MSRLGKLLTIAIAVVLLLGGALLWLRMTPQDAASDVPLQQKAATDVRHVRIDNAHGSYEIRFEDGGYAVHDIPAELIDVTQLAALLRECADISALRVVEASPADVSVYGLQTPQAEVRVDYSDGSALGVRIGDKERVTGNVYMQLDGQTPVYIMEAQRADCFTLPARSLISLAVTPTSMFTSPLGALADISLEGGGLPHPVNIEATAGAGPEVTRAALSFGAATHIVRGNSVYQLDQTYAIETLGPLVGLRAEDVVAYNVSGSALASYGFDNPLMRISFDYLTAVDAPRQKYVLSFAQKDGQTLMTCNGNGVVYVISDKPFLHINYPKLLLRWLLSPMIMDISGVRVTLPERTLAFEVTGETNAEKQATLNGKAVDIDAFRAFYKLITSAASDGELLTGAEAQGEPLLTLEYTYLDAQKAPDVMRLYAGDARRVYAQINGVIEFGIREMFVTRVKEACDALERGEPFDTNW